MATYRAANYGPNPNAGVNVNADHGWGGYQYPGGVPASLLGWASYNGVRSQVRRELVTLYSLAYQIAEVVHGYKIETMVGGEPWGPWGYENRTISGSSTPSNHSKGKANDWNAPRNGYANGFANIVSDFPPAMVAHLESIGLCWGGRYGDAMHWEYGYSPDNVAGHEAVARRILGVGTTGTGTGSKPTTTPTDEIEKDWFDMATRDDLKAVIREMLPEIAVAIVGGPGKPAAVMGEHGSLGDVANAIYDEVIAQRPQDIAIAVMGGPGVPSLVQREHGAPGDIINALYDEAIAARDK